MEDPEGFESSPEYFVPYSRSPITRSRQDDEDDGDKSKPREDLKEYNTIPLDMAQEFDQKFANVPLQDLDPHYTGTFVTITRDHRIHRFGAANALWILTPFSPLRRGAITILTREEFSWFIIFTVLANIHFLVTQNYTDRGFFEIVFVINYTLEFVVKLIARGFLLDKYTYMKDGWNILDLFILFFAYISLITGTTDGMAALRVLKLIPNIYDVRLTYQYFTEVIGHLFDVTILTTFTLCVFALLGQSMFMGLLSQKCIKSFPGGTDEDYEAWVTNSTNWFPYPPPDPPYSYYVCGNATRSGECPEGYVCLRGYGPTPDYGYTSFDSFFWSLLSTIRMFKVDFWEALYQQLIRAGGTWTNVWFLLVMFACPFYLLALIIGVVAKTISESLERRRSQRNKKDILRRRSFIVGTCTTRLRDAFSNVWNKFCECGCLPQCNSVQKWTSLFIFSPVTVVIMKLIIILHTLCLCLNNREEEILEIAIEIFKVIYMIELILKMVALGPKEFFDDGWRKFEFVIVLGILLDYVFENYFMWILRVLVVLRLAQHWPHYERLLHMITASFTKELGAFLLIIQLFIFTFALTGMEWFGARYAKIEHTYEDMPALRWSFVDFSHSYMTVFRALCGEWIETMWDCVYFGGFECTTFFFVMVAIGNFLTLTFFILLYNNVVSTSTEQQNDDEANNPLTSFVNRVKALLGVRNNKSRRPTALPIVEDEDEILDADGRNHISEQTTNPNNSSRFNFTDHRYFKLAMVIIILSATLALAFDDLHLDSNSDVVFIVDIIFTVVIIVEAILKLIGLGLWGYLRNGWCWFDLFIVVVSIVELFQGLGSPRPFRALRLLMIISRIPAMKDIAETILTVVKRIFGTLLATSCLWLCFAVLGVAMLHGKFHKCYDPETGGILNTSHIDHKMDCLEKNMTWENSEMNFDHLPNAFLSLIMVSSFKGWIGIMNDAIDSRGRDQQPEREVSLEMYIYFVVFILICVFLSLGVLLGEAVIQLNKLRNKKLPSLMDRSELYYNAALKLRGRKPEMVAPQPGGKCQGSLYTCFTGKTFDTVNATLMGVYLLIWTSEHEGMNPLWYQAYQLVEVSFILFITVEAILKITVFRRHYFSDPVNIFDFCVVIIASSGLYIAEVGLGAVSPLAFCIVRAARVVISCLGDHNRGIRTLIQTVLASFAEVVMASALLLTVICSYALFGMLQFKHVKLRGALDELHNFQTFRQSFHVMYEITTGAGWDGVLDGLAAEDDCELASPEFPHSDCGNAAVAIPFLISYLVLCFLVIAYMFLTVIQEYFVQHAQAKLDLTKEQVNNFYEVCKQFDSDGSGYIGIDRLPDLMDSLQPPLQVKKENENENNVLKSLPLTRGELVSSEDVFAALVRRHYRNLTECGNFSVT